MSFIVKNIRLACMSLVLMCLCATTEAAKVAVVIDGLMNDQKGKDVNKSITKTMNNIYLKPDFELIQLKDVNKVVAIYREQNHLNEKGTVGKFRDYYYKTCLSSTDVISIGKKLGVDEVMYVATDWTYRDEFFKPTVVNLELIVQVYDISKGSMTFEEMLESTHKSSSHSLHSVYGVALNNALKQLSYKPSI